MKIPHVESGLTLRVGLRQHIGIIWRGAGSYEPEYADVLRKCVKPGGVVFDVGANIGFIPFCSQGGLAVGDMSMPMSQTLTILLFWYGT